MATGTDLERSSSQYWSITDGSQSGLDLTGDFSVVARIKLEALPSTNTNYIIAGKYGYENNQRAYYFSVSNVSDSYYLRLVTSTAGTTATTGDVLWSTPSGGVWYTVGMSKTGTTVTMYVNGSSIGTATVDSSQFNSSATFAIGALVGGSGGTQDFFDGIIDYVVIYNDDIGSNVSKNTGCTFYLTNAVSFWAFESSGADSLGSNTLTNNNSATFASDGLFCISVAETATLTEADKLNMTYSWAETASLTEALTATNIGGIWDRQTKSSTVWVNNSKS